MSKEKRWFVNSPTWSPDGQYIYARHHFVKERSLGAGEIWMYHASGGDGLQVTEKNGWQKDAGEPAVSPDGRYLYYSKDVTPGQTFEYNKDPNGDDLRDHPARSARPARSAPIAAGRAARSRRACRPTARRSPSSAACACRGCCSRATSPPGASVRSGTGLDRDMQEAWAIHGLYPQYAWTPDGRSIVIWAQGQIWRVDAQTGAGRASIPFRARVEQTTYAPLRFPHEVHPARIADPHAARTSRPRPTARRVAYSALGAST